MGVETSWIEFLSTDNQLSTPKGFHDLWTIWYGRPSETLVVEVDRGEQNRYGEIEYTHSHETRLFLHLILGDYLRLRKLQASDLKYWESAIIWELYYHPETLLRILFCYYDNSSVRSGILKSAERNDHVTHSRLSSIKYILNSMNSIGYFPTNLPQDLKVILESIQEIFEDPSKEESSSAWLRKEFDECLGLLENSTSFKKRDLPILKSLENLF